VVTLMGLLAFPAMLKAGYNVKVAAGAVTAGGCLGILIPPSVLLIVYGSVAGVVGRSSSTPAPSCPGSCLRALYRLRHLLAKWRPKLMPPLPESERRVEVSALAAGAGAVRQQRVTGLWRGLTGGSIAGVAKRTVLAQLFVTLLPALFIAAILGITYRMTTAPVVEASTAGLIEAGGSWQRPSRKARCRPTYRAQEESDTKEPSAESPAAREPSAEAAKAPPAAAATAGNTADAAESERLPVPLCSGSRRRRFARLRMAC